jgi:hypothetical protein
MIEDRPWTDMELYVLIQSSREILPTLAEIMHRPHDEIASKYERVHEAFNIQYMEQAKRYVNGGDDEDESYMRVSKEKVDIKKIREVEEQLS